MESGKKITKTDLGSLRSVLGLSKKEERVLLALQGRPPRSVLDIAAAAKVSRPSVYDILKKLKERGLVKSQVMSGRRRFSLESPNALSDTLYRLKQDLLGFADGREEVGAVSDGTVVVHRGKEAVRKKIFDIFATHRDERFLGYQGLGESADAWFSLFTATEINSLNQTIKKSQLLTEAVFPEGWVKEMFKHYGTAWAKDYEGRAAAASYIDPSYFNNSGLLYAFKDAVYLIDLKDQLIIELRHSNLQKMILTFYRFMRDHGRTIDLNGELRKFIDGR